MGMEGKQNQNKRDIDYLYVILPLKKNASKKTQSRCILCWSSLVEIINKKKNTDSFPFKLTKPVIALLPGSRKQEIKNDACLQICCKSFNNYEFIIAGVSNINKIV